MQRVWLTTNKLPWTAPLLPWPHGKERRDTKPCVQWLIFASPVSGKHFGQAASCKDRSGRTVPRLIPGFKKMKKLRHASLFLNGLWWFCRRVSRLEMVVLYPYKKGMLILIAEADKEGEGCQVRESEGVAMMWKHPQRTEVVQCLQRKQKNWKRNKSQLNHVSA